MFRRTAGVVVAALLVGSGVANAATGSLTDPKGDYPDIVKLSFSNGSSKVTMTMTYAGAHPQNESFYMEWGKAGKRYQVFNNPSASIRGAPLLPREERDGQAHHVRRSARDAALCDQLEVRHPAPLSDEGG